MSYADKEIIFTGAALDVMYALYNRGPLEIGDVPSKTGLDFLIKNKLATPIVCKGVTHYAGLPAMAARYNRCTWKQPVTKS